MSSFQASSLEERNCEVYALPSNWATYASARAYTTTKRYARGRVRSFSRERAKAFHFPLASLSRRCEIFNPLLPTVAHMQRAVYQPTNGANGHGPKKSWCYSFNQLFFCLSSSQFYHWGQRCARKTSWKMASSVPHVSSTDQVCLFL